MGEPWKPGGPVRLSDEQFKALDELMLQHAIRAVSGFGGSALKSERDLELSKARQAAHRALTGGEGR